MNLICCFEFVEPHSGQGFPPSSRVAWVLDSFTCDIVIVDSHLISGCQALAVHCEKAIMGIKTTTVVEGNTVRFLADSIPTILQ